MYVEQHPLSQCQQRSDIRGEAVAGGDGSQVLPSQEQTDKLATILKTSQDDLELSSL